MFINLSNHPVATWTRPQITAARALGAGEPTDFASPFQYIPASAMSEAVLGLAYELTRQSIARGAKAAAVFGEPTLTFALVTLLEAAGIPCYAPTTDRIAADRLDGIKVIKTATFEFVRWRRYPIAAHQV